MCGIAGWIGESGDPTVLQQMTDAISHRGPDGDGQIVLPLIGANVAALGHRRLAIIDTSESGAQPMASHDGRYHIVFNGEIYNYIELRDELRRHGAVFRSESDTEVILEAWRKWGVGALTRFRGMFSLALYDGKERTVVLARDPFGKKPLFYAERPSGDGVRIVFGSEIQALLCHPDVEAKLDLDSLYDYLSRRYTPGPNTMFAGIRKLLPGSHLTWKDGRITQDRYWLPPEENPSRPPAPDDPVDAFRAVFDEAVKIRLRSDVPIGAFLSSGLDSAAIVATLAHLGVPAIRTYSIGFGGDLASELPGAAQTSAYLGTKHTPIEINSNDLTRYLPMLSRHRGAPVAESADLPIYVMSTEAAKDVKVVLSGEGADELFAGYPKHMVERHLGRAASSGLLEFLGRGLLASLTLGPGSNDRLRIAGRAMSERDFGPRMTSWFGALTTEERDRLWTGPVSDRPVNAIPYQAAPGSSPLRQVLHYDQTSWLPDNLLERMDTMSMAASIEARNPFMDTELAAFSASLPDEWRIKRTITKRIIREALGPRLPEGALNRKKIGFRMPVAEWFRGPLKDPAREILLSSDSIAGQYLDHSLLSSLIHDHVTAESNHEKSMWSLYTLELFLREFFS